MLITADVARRQSSNKFRSAYKNSYIRELRSVEIAINRASKKGKTSVEYRCLCSKVIEILKNNGYLITRCIMVVQEWFVISWNETN